jgi:hypothetical protein
MLVWQLDVVAVAAGDVDAVNTCRSLGLLHSISSTGAARAQTASNDAYWAEAALVWL